MTSKHLLRVALATAFVAAALSAFGGAPQATFAQSEAPTPEPAATEDAAADPAKADVIIWTPSSGSLSVVNNGNVTVRVANTSGTLDPASAQYNLIINGVPQGYQNVASATPVGSNATLDLTANVGGTPSGNAILFRVTPQGSGSTESAIYTLSRSSILHLPISNNQSGASTIPTVLNTTGVNSCDASLNRRGGPLSPYVNYSVLGLTSDIWMFAINPIPGASIVVSAPNYTTAGQLQVWAEVAGCGNIGTQPLAFSASQNPIVQVNNVPRGVIYFRVVSAVPGVVPQPFVINWAYSQNVGPFEPNNNPCEAILIPAGTQLTTLVSDQYDFFAMNITGTGTIQVAVQGFTIGGAQVQVRTPLLPGFFCPGNGADPVASTALFNNNFAAVPSGGGDVFLNNVFISAPGLYYIRVSLPNGVAPNNTQYRVSWNYLGGGGGSGTAGPIFTTNPAQPPSCNPAVAGTCAPDIPGNVAERGFFTYYWFGMNNLGAYDTMQIRIRGDINLDGCPKNVFPSDPTQVLPNGYGNNWGNLPTLAPNGSQTFQFNKHGAYAVAFRVMRGGPNGQQLFFDEKPLRVGCGFQASSFIDKDGNITAFQAPSLLDQPDREVVVVDAGTGAPDVKPHP